MQNRPDTLKVGKSKFKAPLNLDSTLYGLQKLAKEITYTQTLYYDTRMCSGYIDIALPEKWSDYDTTIGLQFWIDKKGKRTLVDYDGIFSIPTQCLDFLELHGVDCKEMRKYGE